MANTNLTEAKRAKQDEFYTRLEDISDELYHYRHHFKGKSIFLNCDDPEWSNFWRYFELNFDDLGLTRLVSTHYHPTERTYKLVMERDESGEITTTKTPLEGNGDFRSAECIELLEEADIVTTNPPFSLFREYVAQLVEHQKKFLIIGNKNAITYKEIFPLFMNSQIWIGYSPMGKDMLFNLPDDIAKMYLQNEKAGSKYRIVDGVVYGRATSCWFTNMDIDKRHQPLTLWKDYDAAEYPHYDNYDAIEVSKVAEIPVDYYGVMGVPITFLDKYCPEQFEILGSDGFDYFPPTKTYSHKQKVVNGQHMKSQSGTLGCCIRVEDFGKGTFFDVGYPIRSTYKRIFIQRVDQPDTTE